MKSCQFLIIDDEEPILKLLKRFLERFAPNCKMIGTNSGKNAIEIMSKNPSEFTACIIDYNLPDYSCENLVEELKKMNHSLKVILSTGNIAEDLKSSVGADACLQKPFTIDEFTRLLSDLNFIE